MTWTARPRKTLYWRLASLLLLILLSSAIVLLFNFFRSWRDLEAESVQRLNLNLGASFAAVLQPHLSPRIEHPALERAAAELSSFAPGTVMLLLDRDGVILDTLPRSFPLNRTKIDTAPIEALLAGKLAEGGALFGDDPSAAGGKGVFSAARVKIGPEDGYLYIFLRSFGSNVLESIAGTGRAGREIIFHFMLFTLLAAGIGVWILYRVTRRFYRIVAALESWRSGRQWLRIEDSGTDEIRALADSLNEMAGIIQTSITELERKDQVRRDLVAAVSHDLRGPVGVLKGHAEMLLTQEQELPAEPAKRIDRMFRSIRSLESLIAELFELAKLDAKEAKPELTGVSLRMLCEDVVMKFDALAEERGVTLTAAVPNDDRPVLADGRLIDRVLFNLVGNAFRYTPAGGRITITAEFGSESARLSVSDTGQGIPADKLGRIFEKFYRVEEDDSSGSGLGLTIVQKILEVHGTAVNVESRIGRGTVFSFHLPYARASSVADPQASHS